MSNKEKNLWILTEERPKKEVLQMILEKFAKDQDFKSFTDKIRIIPILNKSKHFIFTYKVIGFTCARVKHIYIKTISGYSSFIDFLVYHQNCTPNIADTPLYAIEETKTDDSESRNTGVYQRCSKFVFIDNYYPQTKKIMLYALQIKQKEKPTETNIFGTRLLLTLGVEVLGKDIDRSMFKPFTSIDEVIAFKASMRQPPKGNVPIALCKSEDKIQISGRLLKSGRLSHDPNIGALSIIAAVLRKLKWDKRIEIMQHGLQQKHVSTRNKFVFIANMLGIELEGLTVPKAKTPQKYWRYDMEGEKLGTIFIHIVVENFTESYSIFENHAGCEKDYFLTSQGEYVPLAKYADREAYKKGNKSQIVSIPDLVLLDIENEEVITIEGKKYKNKKQGIKELNNYNSFDELYLKEYYPHHKIVRTVVLYGSTKTQELNTEVGFLLKKNGEIVLNKKAPSLFIKAIRNLLDFWQ